MARDFNELKQRVSMTVVLDHYGLLAGLKSQKGGDELVGLVANLGVKSRQIWNRYDRLFKWPRKIEVFLFAQIRASFAMGCICRRPYSPFPG